MPVSSTAPITDAERAVFELLASGLTAAQVAYQLGLPVVTVRTRSAAVQCKLGASSLVQAVRIAIARGLLPVAFTLPRPPDQHTPSLFPAQP